MTEAPNEPWPTRSCAGPRAGASCWDRSARQGNPFQRLPTGAASTYVATDDPDGVYERATGAGATVVRGLDNEDYGSPGFTVSDPDGNLWSFGMYQGS